MKLGVFLNTMTWFGSSAVSKKETIKLVIPSGEAGRDLTRREGNHGGARGWATPAGGTDSACHRKVLQR